MTQLLNEKGLYHLLELNIYYILPVPLAICSSDNAVAGR